MSLGSADVTASIRNVHPFDPVSQYGAIIATSQRQRVHRSLHSHRPQYATVGDSVGDAGRDPVLIHYVSVEYDSTRWEDVFTSGTPVIQDVLYWFSKTLDQCSAGDCLIINGDFLSIDYGALRTISDKINEGMRFILVVDRWEVSGVPLYGSVEGQPWSPSQIGGNGCPTCDSNGCDEGTNDFPYACCGSVAGSAKGQYCNDMNNVIRTIRQWTQNGKYASNFSIFDAATTKVSGMSSSRQAPLHNHRHMTTFYMPSKNAASVFKGSWNFTSGVPSDDVTVPGQKESGLVITAALDNAVIQADLAINYYWLTTLAVYVQGQVSAPATFTAPGPVAPMFVYLLGMIAPRYIDSANDVITFEPYGKTYEVYGFVRSGSNIYVSADPAAKLSLGVSPPPASAAPWSPALPNPTPWEGAASTMLDRVLNDGGYSSAPFKTMWPSISCVSNTNQFLYPYVSTYSNNPVLAQKWRVPLNSRAPHCSSSPTGTVVKTRNGVRPSLGTNTCIPVTVQSGVGAACFTPVETKGVSNLIPNGSCYNIDGTDYECSARIPWAPGANWIGGLMYKFWKDAGTNANRSVYVNMYSSMVDSGTGCILNCGQGYSGGQSAWNSSLLTSSQYKFDKAGAIDSRYWYSQADSNSVQNVLDFLAVKGAELSIIAGQWSNINPGVNGALSMYKNKAAAAESVFNYGLYHAQKFQTTSSGTEPGASKTTLDKDGNPSSGNNWERNHTKCYLSKDSILSSSGHPYNGGVLDWAGINECVLIENCPNLCKPLRVNFEQEYRYSNTVRSASTFPWGNAWAGMDLATPINDTVLNNNGWGAGSGGGISTLLI